MGYESLYSIAPLIIAELDRRFGVATRSIERHLHTRADCGAIASYRHPSGWAMGGTGVNKRMRKKCLGEICMHGNFFYPNSQFVAPYNCNDNSQIITILQAKAMGMIEITAPNYLSFLSGI